MVYGLFLVYSLGFRVYGSVCSVYGSCFMVWGVLGPI